MRKPASAHESLSHMTICRPSIAAGTTGQSSVSGVVERTIPPGCCEGWRGSPQASRTSRASARQRGACARRSPIAIAMSSLEALAGPGVHRAGHPLDLGRRQAQRLAEVAHRAAHPEGGEGGDQSRALVAVALVDARDQLLAHVAGEVEVDVRRLGDLLVQEAAQEQPRLDRVHVREPGQVADDRADARAPASPRRQHRPRRLGAAHLAAPPRAPAPAGRRAAGRSRRAGACGSPQLLVEPPPRLAQLRACRRSGRRSARRRARRACGRRSRPRRPG